MRQAAQEIKSQRFFVLLVWGFVFGIVACFSFCLLYPMVSEHLSGDPKEVTIPRDTEEEKETKNSGTVEEELSTEDFSVIMASGWDCQTGYEKYGGDSSCFVRCS